MTKLHFSFKSTTKVNLGLHSGCISGNLGLVKFALDNGQPIDSVLNGLLPIHAASCSGHILVVKYLIEKGCDVNARRKPRKYSGNLLSRSKDVVGSTALHFAAANGNLEVIELLLQNGASINAVDKYGSTPLSIALAKQNIDAVMMMLQQGIESSELSNEFDSLSLCSSTDNSSQRTRSSQTSSSVFSSRRNSLSGSSENTDVSSTIHSTLGFQPDGLTASSSLPLCQYSMKSTLSEPLKISLLIQT